MTITETILKLAQRDDCKVLPPKGLPVLSQSHALPSDLNEFYSHCGGLLIKPFKEKFFSWYVFAPENLRPAVPTIHKGELSEFEHRFWEKHWANAFYVIAYTESDDELIVTDCGGRYTGIYFDGHRETFGCADMPVVAESLSALLSKLVSVEIGSMPPNQPSHKRFIKDLPIHSK